MADYFAQPFMYWIAVDLATEDPSEVEAWHRYYTGTHLPEVVAANPGFVHGHRYELVAADRSVADKSAADGERGGALPHYLCVYEIADEAGARTYAERNDGPPEGRPTYTPGPPVWAKMRPKWRMIWRSFAETAAPTGVPESVFLAGLELAADESDASLAEFNDFYTNVHLGEVAAKGGFARATRHERFREFVHPEPGCPRYLAVYEAHGPTNELGGFTPGPPAWSRADTRWLARYRRIS